MKCDVCDFKPECDGLEGLAFEICPECERCLCEKCIKDGFECYCKDDDEFED